MHPLLEVDGLRVDYPGLIAVLDFHLALEPGDAYALVGPNGAGKTSTMRAIAGLLVPTRGHIRVAGFDLEADPQNYRRHLGYMPDFSPVYDRLTTTEFLDHFAGAYGVANPARRIAECLKLTGLADKARAQCRTLSRGMKQRLILAKTLVPDPAVLLLDEPASGLDPLSRIELRRVINDLRDAGKALLVSSHILGEVGEYSNKVGILERGQLVLSGRIDELAARTAGRRMRVRWRPDTIGALERLEVAPGVVEIVPHERGADFAFRGDDASLDDLLAQLVKAGARITEWCAAEDDLEHVFMELGARAVR